MRNRVVFFNRFYWPDESATAQILTDLAEYLAGHGWEVEVVTSRLRYTDARVVLPAADLCNGVRVHRLWSTRFGRGRLVGRLSDYLTIYLSFAAWLLRHARAGQIVVMKTDPPLLSVLGWLFKDLQHYRLVAWCQDVFPEVAIAGLPPRRWLRPVYSLLRHARDLSLNGSECTAVLSEDMRQYLLRQGVRAPIAKLPNWAVHAGAADAEEVARLRREWGLEGRFVVGYSGNLGRVHDWETVRDAIPLLADVPGLAFLFVGGGAGYEALRRALAGVRRPLVVFRPYQPRERLAASLAVPDIHWLSLRPEMTPFVFPSKLYGILAAGKPVIFVGDSRSELAAMVATNGCGFRVDCGDGATLQNILMRLTGDPQLMLRLQAAARRFQRAPAIHGRHEWRRVLEHVGRPDPCDSPRGAGGK